MGTGDWGLGKQGKNNFNHYSSPAKRRATANSTHYSALITQNFQVRIKMYLRGFINGYYASKKPYI
ncbi:hypothetical protein [Nostoc sp. CMAA1605]|uniref:hypothetical protein n=1 Tax=Nostoc sp. CMAA1605 TaxID=2055159 RepID=UPI001F36BDE4|nr:hypothetical protein [Nostoc sp. CMAA1605]